jgi:hypothetical protein
MSKDKNKEKITGASTADKKPRVNQNDKYYKIKADFSYLSSYNFRITKEIGRGGYGVVYKVFVSLISRLSISLLEASNNLPLRSTLIQFRGNSYTPKWRFCY